MEKLKILEKKIESMDNPIAKELGAVLGSGAGAMVFLFGLGIAQGIILPNIFPSPLWGGVEQIITGVLLAIMGLICAVWNLGLFLSNKGEAEHELT